MELSRARHGKKAVIIHSFIHFIRLKKNTLTILHNPQIAKLIEAGRKNETKIKK